MRWSGSSYIGGGRERQSPPFARALAMAGLALSLGACSQVGLPMVEADSPQHLDRMTTGATLISARVSDPVDPSDWEAVRRAVATADDDGESNIAWSNPDTGSDGTITAAPAVAGKNGKLCRTLATTISDNKGVRLYRGQACQRTDGRWQIVSIAADDATLS